MRAFGLPWRYLHNIAATNTIFCHCIRRLRPGSRWVYSSANPVRKSDLYYPPKIPAVTFLVTTYLRLKIRMVEPGWFNVERVRELLNEEEKIEGLDFSDKWTQQTMLQRIQEVLTGHPPLLARQFETVMTIPSNPHPVQRVRIMQWNMLSQSLSTGPDNFVKCPESALHWPYRRLRILEEILQVDPDILCLQEVDHFRFMQVALGALGYEGVFIPKPDSPALYTDGTNGPDGCAMFYKTDRLENVSNNTIVLRDRRTSTFTNQVSVICVFKPINQETGFPGKEFCVATTHLKAKLGWEKLRYEQGSYLLDYLEKNFGSLPLFLCGDLNADCNESIYAACENSKLNITSAYRNLSKDGQEPPYTTWKFRGHTYGVNEVRRTIDFIWHTKEKIQVTALQNFPSAEAIGEDRLPSMQYPSDHLSLAADFVIS